MKYDILRWIAGCVLGPVVWGTAVGGVSTSVGRADAGSAYAGSAFVTYTGTAATLRGQQFLYGERHVFVHRGDEPVERVVLYTCRDGTPFARKTVAYVDGLAPNFTLEDSSTGMHEGIRDDGNGRVVFFQARRTEVERSAGLPRSPTLVADAGFDEFVRTHWQSLMQGEAQSVRFLVPSRLGDFAFDVRHERHVQLDGAPAEVFRLKLAGVAGWLLSGIDVYYGAADHVLMRYVGISDLRGADGGNLPVDIEFHAADRRVGTAEDLEAAGRASLAPCR